MIYIYNGPGVSNNSFQAVKSLFQKHYKNFSVNEIAEEEVNQGEWVNKATLFVMPGGRDIPYVSSLAKGGIDSIRYFVQRGGKYLGICAGAYFAADCIEFEKGSQLEVIGERHLKFYPGKAVGTLFGMGYSYTTFEHVTDATILSCDIRYSLLYNGGCFFEDPEKYPMVTTLAHYVHADNKAAVIQTSYGKGKALLSGVHFEYDAALISTLPIDNITKEKLMHTEHKREAFARQMLNHLMINT